MLCKRVVTLNLLGLPICIKIAGAYKAKASGRISTGWGGRCSVVDDVCKRRFRKILAMAPAWFSHGGPDVGRITVSRLVHRGNVSGSNVTVGWTPVRKLLWCCSGVQPSAGIGIAFTCHGW